MYTIWIVGNNTPLHNNFLQESGNICINPVVETQLNGHGSLTFSVAQTNPLYGAIERLTTYIKVLDNEEEIWRGRVLSVERGVENIAQVYCEGEFGYLCDSIERPFAYQGTPQGLLELLLTNHNSQMVKRGSGGTMVYDTQRQFTVGNVTVTGDVDVRCESAQTTWDAVGKLLLQQHGGYIRTRKSGSTVYIDYLADFPDTSGQEVRYGYNLIDFQQTIDASAVITQMIAYGAKKTHAAKLYKQVGSSNNFELYTEDIVPGKYLFVVNGCAMNNTLSNGKLGTTLVTISNDTITTSASGAVVWIVSESDIDMSENVEITASTSSSMTIGSDYIDSDGDAHSASMTAQQSGQVQNHAAKVGGSLDGNTTTNGNIQLAQNAVSEMSIPVGDQRNGAQSIKLSMGQTTTNVSVASTETRRAEYLIKNAANNKYLMAALAAPGKLALTDTAGKLAVWKINNGETGTTVNNVQKGNDKEFATLYGDLDSGFWLAQNASADKTTLPSDADRVTAKKDNSGSDVIVSTDGIELWGMRIWGTKVFEDAQTPQEVKAAANAYLANMIAEHLTISTTAADLSLIYPETQRFDVGYYVWCRPWLDAEAVRLLCRQVHRYLDEPEKTQVTLGVGIKTLSDLQGGLIADVSNS